MKKFYEFDEKPGGLYPLWGKSINFTCEFNAKD
jgi:hypothetical protein